MGEETHTRGDGAGRALLAAASPVFGRPLARWAREMGLEVEPLQEPAELDAHLADSDLCLVQQDLGAGRGIDLWAAAIEDIGAHKIPLIAFGLDNKAESQVLERGASDFLQVPCGKEQFRALIQPWLRISRLERVRPPEVDPTLPAPAAGPKSTRSATILLVDDSQVIHTYVENALQGSGHRLLHAHDGFQGIEVALESRPDVIISDVDMPRLGATTCAADCARRHRHATSPS